MTDLIGHKLELRENDQVVTHPEDDIPECGFDEYAATWETMPSFFRPSRWEFIRRTDDNGNVDWLGTRLDTQGQADA
jgi:hypothetical protein